MGNSVQSVARPSTALQSVNRPIGRFTKLYVGDTRNHLPRASRHDPFNIPDHLGRQWGPKRYGTKGQHDGYDEADPKLANPSARCLLLKTPTKEGNWRGLGPSWKDPNIGSILVVDRGGGDIKIEDVEKICRYSTLRLALW